MKLFGSKGKKDKKDPPLGLKVSKYTLGPLGLTLISGAAPFRNTMARRKVVSFLDPMTADPTLLFIRNPSQAFNFAAYVEPMHSLAWIFVMVFCLLTPPFLYITTK